MQTAHRLQTRQEEFMTPFSPLDLLKQRETFAVELRRQNRSRQIQLKRTATREGETAQMDADGRPLPEAQLRECCPGLYEAIPLSEKIALVTEKLNLRESNLGTLQALRWVRRLFLDTSIGQLCHRQLLRAVVDCCSQAGPMELEASWALANLSASANSIEELLTEFPLIQHLLQSSDPRVSEHGLYVLGNLVSSGKVFLERAVGSYMHKEVVALLLRQRQLKAIKRVGSWVLSVFLRFRLELSVVWTLAEALVNIKDDISKAVQSYLLSAILGISHWEDQYLKLLFKLDLVRPVIHRLPHLEGEELMNALCVCVNISAGDVDCTQQLLDLGLLDVLQPFLANSSSNVRVRALESLTNVAGSSAEQVSQLLQHACFEIALSMLQDQSLIIKTEASMLLLNVCNNRQLSHLERLLDLNIFANIHSALDADESGLLKVLPT
jgi:hypothetical protein